MREEARVEIKTQAPFFAPVDPALEMSGRELIARDRLSSAEVGVYRMEVQPMLAWNEREALSKSWRNSSSVRALPG